MSRTVRFTIDEETWKQLDDYAYAKGHKNISGMCLFALLQCTERNALTQKQRRRIEDRHRSP
jgi:hypothetical protein